MFDLKENTVFQSQKARWKAEALPTALLFLHWAQQCWQIGERRTLQQHGAAQYTNCPPGQFRFPKPDPQAAAHNPYSEDTLTANPAHGEQGKQMLSITCCFFNEDSYTALSFHHMKYLQILGRIL